MSTLLSERTKSPVPAAYLQYVHTLSTSLCSTGSPACHFGTVHWASGRPSGSTWVKLINTSCRGHGCSPTDTPQEDTAHLIRAKFTQATRSNTWHAQVLSQIYGWEKKKWAARWFNEKIETATSACKSVIWQKPRRPFCCSLPLKVFLGLWGANDIHSNTQTSSCRLKSRWVMQWLHSCDLALKKAKFTGQ